MKRSISLLFICGLLTMSFASCAQDETTPSSETSVEVTTEEASEAETTAPETETTTEEVTEPEYYSSLVYPDTMTDKEKANTAYRDFTLIHFSEGMKIGQGISTYMLESDTFDMLVEHQDEIRELKIYDEQLDTNFLAHIVLPPDYDENKEYPVILVSDASMWFNETMMMYKMMEDGEAEPVILLALGVDYDRDGRGDEERSRLFIVHHDQMLDFITENLMKFISLNYKVDASRSVFLGHSWGGLFSHYALCHADKYEYQPFRNYIIGSAMLSMMGEKEYWNVDIPWAYDDAMIAENASSMNEYDYFDNHETMDKNVLVAVGSKEVEHYEWAAGMTMVDNAQALYDRLKAHGVNAELRIFEDKHHGNYGKELMTEYLVKTFPPEGSSADAENLVFPDTMTDKEKKGTYYREDTILDADKAYEIGEYHLPLNPTQRSRVKKMIGNVREMRIYDEQLDLNFMANIVLPPDYDENKEYPVVLITDSQYWIDEVANLWKLIGDGETSPVIFATLRLDYEVNGYDDEVRYGIFAEQQDKMLDFITNDFMPLVSLNYKTDASKSVFFGHSLGGLFSHYALCNSDKYDYQPFASYIIASPAMWSYYYEGQENNDISAVSDPYAYRDDFGYFDRNETMDKNVFICAGADEHYDFDAPDLPTIPEDAQTVYDRFKAHGVNADIKLYEGMMHMSYVEDMLKEYYKQHFPPEGNSQE